MADQGAANTAAVVTAAAIAATAPLLKAQSDMEVRVSQVSESLRQLLEADHYPGCRESRQVAEGRASERVAQLEEQLNALTQQRLQHLEMIQNQQIELQSRLLGSALSVVTCHAPVTSVISAPVPTSNFSSDGLVVQPATSGQQPASLLTTHLDTAGVDTGMDIIS
ncbi:TALPID3 protein-like [Aplochiton taeniatus]